MKLKILISFVTLVFFSCKSLKVIEPLNVVKDIKDSVKIETTHVHDKLLPENLVSYDSSSKYTAYYIEPTTRYAHGILGDAIEAAGLVVNTGKDKFSLILSEDLVFEDLAPRLKDINGDGIPEIICIRSAKTGGAGVVVYQIKSNKLEILANSDYIGTPNRWLNIVAIDDLDGDGKIEIAWVQTPHIGGILKIAQIVNDKLVVKDEISGITAHKLGSKNICLSFLEKNANKISISLPNMAYTEIWKMKFENGKIIISEKRSQIIDPQKAIYEQLSSNSALKNVNCIIAK